MASIGLLNSIDSRPILALSFKSAGIGHMPFPALFRSGDPIPTFIARRFEAPGKKTPG